MKISNFRLFCLPTAILVCTLHASDSFCAGRKIEAPGIGNWLSFAANVPEAGYRKTQFFDTDYNTGIAEWDSRLELWLPPSRDKFAWGPYVRFSGIAGSRPDAWQNALLGAPGLGFQIYPFSTWRFQQQDSKAGKLLGPLRFFAEYNRTHYWGEENKWRPHEQSRIGFEYWKAINVNEPEKAWWLETWHGLFWQSSNEFTDKYKAIKFANAFRSGIRVPHRRTMSALTPYLAIESSRTKYNYVGAPCAFAAGDCNFYWENRLLVGGGLRIAPSLINNEPQNRKWLRRFVIYCEYLNTATYYGPTAPSSVPRFDVRVGVSASIGQWYK